MTRKMTHVVRLILPTLFACLGACGGSDVAATRAESDPTRAGTLQAVHTKAPAAQPGLPSVCHGFNVVLYASVAQPMKLSFAPDGALYVGSQGGSDRIHRVAPGGGTGIEFGPPMSDPDAVLFDAGGRISGVRNSVLVGGSGIIAAIFPGQTSQVIFNAGFADVDDMTFDRKGRLVFSDDLPQVLTSKGEPPRVLLSTPSRPGSIAIDDGNRIFVALGDGTIRIYRADGTPAHGPFATGLAGLDTYLAFGPGAGGFGKALYVLNGSDLLRFDMNGHTTVIGSGFNVGPSSGTGFVFGPDNALYISDYLNNRILRIARGHSEPEGCSRRKRPESAPGVSADIQTRARQ
jgi:hypothetical protein